MNQLVKYRAAAGLTQKGLAELIGSEDPNAQVILKLESGITIRGRASTRANIVAIFNLKDIRDKIAQKIPDHLEREITETDVFPAENSIPESKPEKVKKKTKVKK